MSWVRAPAGTGSQPRVEVDGGKEEERIGASGILKAKFSQRLLGNLIRPAKRAD